MEIRGVELYHICSTCIGLAFKNLPSKGSDETEPFQDNTLNVVDVQLDPSVNDKDTKIPYLLQADPLM